MLLIFLASFGQVALVSFNARNAVQSRYISAFFISLAVSIFNVINTKILVEGNFKLSLIIASGIGGACGVVAGPFLHKKFMKKKPVHDW